MRRTAPPLSLSEKGAVAAVCLALFGLYLSTLCPTLHLGDDGDMITAGWVLGVPHPSGYPLFTLSSKLAMVLVPVGNLAERVNVLSAVCAAAAAAMLWIALRAGGLGFAGSFCGSLCLGLTSSVWDQAVVGRVYTLNLLVFCATLAAALHARRLGLVRSSALICLIGGVGTGNHLMAVLAVLTALCLLPLNQLRHRRQAVTAAMASSVALALGLSVYLLLPVRASVGVPLNWRDPQTWDAFKIMLSRGDYWFKKEVFSLDDLWQVIASLANDVSALFSWPVLTLATAGLVWSVVQRRQILFAAGCWAVGNFALVASHGSRYDLYETNRYFMMLHAALVLLAACGAEATAAVLGNLRLAPRRATAIAAVSATALIAVPALFHYPAADQSRAYFAFDYAHNLLRNTSQNATLGVFADNEAFTTAYLSIVERVRPDVTLFSLTGDLFPNSLVLIDTAWYDPSRDAIEREIIQAAPAEVFYTEVRQLRGIPGWILLPYGMLYRLQPDDQPISLFDQWYLFVARDMGQPLPYKDSLLTWLEESYREIPVRHQQLANVVQQLQRLKQIEQREPHQTLATLERAELLASREMFSQARTVLADGLRRNPRSTQLLMALGKLEFYRNKRLGLRLLRQATVAGPTDPEAWSALAFAYDRTLQIGPAIAAWKKATRYATTATNKVTAEDTVIRLMDFQAKTGLR